MKPQVYKDDRPAQDFARFHERTRRKPPGPMYDLVRVLVTPYLSLFHQARAIDVQKVPKEGPVILAPNHFSFMDHFFVGIYLRRKVQFMAKSQLFRFPLEFVFSNGGTFPVLRGRRDEEAFKTAHAVLDKGRVVVMYCEGGRSRSGELGKPRPGIGRLALESGVSVVPIAIFGTAWTRNWKRPRLPRVTVKYGDPLRFERHPSPSLDEAQAASEAIFTEIKSLYYGLARAGRRGAVRAARAARRSAESPERVSTG